MLAFLGRRGRRAARHALQLLRQAGHVQAVRVAEDGQRRRAVDRGAGVADARGAHGAQGGDGRHLAVAARAAGGEAAWGVARRGCWSVSQKAW